MAAELSTIVEEYLSNGLSLQPKVANNHTMHEFCARVYHECGVPPATRRSARACLLHVMPIVIQTKDDAALVFPLVRKLIELCVIDRIGGFQPQTQWFVRLNKVFANTDLRVHARQYFYTTREQLGVSRDVALARKELRTESKVVVRYVDVIHNIAAGLESPDIAEIIIALISSCGARMIEIVRLGTFTSDNQTTITQTGIAKADSGDTITITKPLVGCTFAQFVGALARVREDVPPHLTNGALSARYAAKCATIVRRCYPDVRKWKSSGSHFCRGLYASVAFEVAHGTNSQHDRQPFFRKVLGHKISLDNYFVTTIIMPNLQEDQIYQLRQELAAMSLQLSEPNPLEAQVAQLREELVVCHAMFSYVLSALTSATGQTHDSSV